MRYCLLDYTGLCTVILNSDPFVDLIAGAMS